MQHWIDYQGPAFDYAGDKLIQAWEQIHAGNKEPLPTDDSVLDVWRKYHQGDFDQAVQVGQSIGGAALVPAALAATIYAQYLQQDADKKAKIFRLSMQLADNAVAVCPESPNAHYVQTVCQGRYSQFINIIEALKQGIGGNMKNSILKALELQPNHAEAHVTYAAWNVEIVDKMGAMLGGLTYGAKKEQAEAHYDEALVCAPDSPVGYIEKARGILTMYGESVKQDATKLLEDGLSKTPMDAMQWLDQQQAKTFLKSLPDTSF